MRRGAIHIEFPAPFGDAGGTFRCEYKASTTGGHYWDVSGLREEDLMTEPMKTITQNLGYLLHAIKEPTAEVAP